MLKQRTLVSDHCKEIKNKKAEIESIIGGADEVEKKLMTIIKNEQVYLQKQMEAYYRQLDIEESIRSNTTILRQEFQKEQEEDCSSEKLKLSSSCSEDGEIRRR